MVNQRSPTGSVELVFSFHDERCFFVALSERADCGLVAEGAVHREDGNMLEFFTVHGARPEMVLHIADDLPSVRDARVVSEHPNTTLMEFIVTDSCVTATLADTGAMVREATAKSGHARIVADVSPNGDVRRVVNRFFDRYDDAQLLSKRTLGRTIPALSNRAQNAHLTAELTDKQLRAVEIATREGYLMWPRESTATECAAKMNVSQPTFSQHLWTGLGKLLTAMFEPDEDTEANVLNDIP